MTAKPAKTTTFAPSEENLFGSEARADDPAALQEAIELAFHYRGDVSLVRRSNPEPIEGYLFDRRTNKETGELIIRMIPRNSAARIAIAFSDIAALKFTGRDTASGKSFENWIKKYAEKKLAGETASIESESLDEE